MSVSLKQSYDIEYDGTANVARMDLFADTAGDLTGLTTFDSITLLQGSTAEDISTGDVYMMKTDGTWVKQPSQSAFANVYTKAEIDSMFYMYYTKTEADAMFEWITATITTDTLPLTFIADGLPLISWSMLGNGSQTGTPTPDNPVMPEFVGTLDNSDWTVPITCAGQTTPVYLGQVQTVRRIRKLVLTGDENWDRAGNTHGYFTTLPNTAQSVGASGIISSHYQSSMSSADGTLRVAKGAIEVLIYDNYTSVSDFKSYLAAQYAAGTPVCVWYVLATPQNAIVNEPLAKIGDYADELSSADAAVTIPTVRGENTMTIDTTLQPSEISITGKIREVTENEQ